MSKFDLGFTQKLRDWINNENRDYVAGVMLLYRLRANPVEFRRLSADPVAYKDYIFAQLKKFLDFRTGSVSHQEVAERISVADSIARAAAADSADSGEGSRSGRRHDHDSLPDEIKKCYVDNLDLMRQISDRHTKMRLIIQSDAPCKDADLLPFADEIVRLDKIRLANWKKYDSYRPDNL
ncbi:MAG: hypothetical protein K2L59_04075 [Muribaculaceae bacterium]|nr:hypothetical protein [Muribaculaceae bacterium]